MSFSQLEYGAKKRKTRRDRFLAEIEAIVPWAMLAAAIEPFYPKGEGRGRPPIGLERMLRMYIAQQCFGLSDEGVEDAVYDSQAIRGFVGIDLSRENVPDSTTLLKFRRLLEKHRLTERIFQSINEHLAAKGLTLREGTVVDASIIAAPPSTKNRDGKRDPEVHQTKKGNQWHFGMKAHIGVDADSGLTHTLVTTPANAADVTKAHELLHGEETDAFGDAGYRGAEKRDEQKNVATRWHVALRPGKRRALPNNPQGRIAEQVEQLQSSVRAKVEHPFSHHQEPVWAQEGPLPRSVQEHLAAVHAVCDGESPDHQEAADGASRSRCVLSCMRMTKCGTRARELAGNRNRSVEPPRYFDFRFEGTATGSHALRLTDLFSVFPIGELCPRKRFTWKSKITSLP